MGKFVELDLDPETVEKFEEIKEFLGVKDDAKALRYIILQFIDRIRGTKFKESVEDISKFIVKSWKMEVREKERAPWIGFIVNTRELQIDYSFDVVKELKIIKHYTEDIDTPIIVLEARNGDNVCKVHIGFECAKKLEEFITCKNNSID